MLISHIKKKIRVEFYENEDELSNAIVLAFKTVKAENCVNWCKHSFDIINIWLGWLSFYQKIYKNMFFTLLYNEVLFLYIHLCKKFQISSKFFI